jgi:hypothetical protein
MIALSPSASRPCVFDDAGKLTPFVAAVANLTTCTPVVVGGVNVGGPPTFTLFDSWASLPDNPGNAGRLSVARGQTNTFASFATRSPIWATILTVQCLRTLELTRS